MILDQDFSHLVCKPDVSLRTVIKMITELGEPFTFQIVIDEEGKPIGTVTDGDIRRAFLQGASTESRVVDFMHAEPATADATASESELLKTADSMQVQFLPLVNQEGLLVSVYVKQESHSESHIALIMAGGRGERLGAQTDTVPKPLVEVGGKPMLGHVLDHLEEAGIEQIYISVHYLAEQIEKFISERESRSTIKLLWEEMPLGTAGAISLLGPVTTPVMVLNCDVMTSVDHRAMGVFHGRHDHDATIAVVRHVVHIPFGVVRHDEEGLFQGIEEKPSINHFVSAGIYQLSPEVCALATAGTRLDMPELLNCARGAGLKVGLFPVHEEWMDVGMPKDLEAAQNTEWSQTKSRHKEGA